MHHWIAIAQLYFTFLRALKWLMSMLFWCQNHYSFSSVTRTNRLKKFKIWVSRQHDALQSSCNESKRKRKPRNCVSFCMRRIHKWFVWLLKNLTLNALSLCFLLYPHHPFLPSHWQNTQKHNCLSFKAHVCFAFKVLDSKSPMLICKQFQYISAYFKATSNIIISYWHLIPSDLFVHISTL